MAEALDDDVVDDDSTVKRYHSQIRTDAERLTALVDDLFELSRINSGSLRLGSEKIDLCDALADSLAGAGAAAEFKGVRMVERLGPTPPVEVSAREFCRAVDNLLDNAIRHTPPGRTVTVEAASEPGAAVIRVGDQCGGIPESDLPRVFDIAFRGDDARQRDDRGGGLGLAITRGLIEAHSGSVTVANGEGGCSFTVRLPGGAAGDRPEAGGPGGRRMDGAARRRLAAGPVEGRDHREEPQARGHAAVRRVGVASPPHAAGADRRRRAADRRAARDRAARPLALGGPRHRRRAGGAQPGPGGRALGPVDLDRRREPLLGSDRGGRRGRGPAAFLETYTDVQRTGEFKIHLQSHPPGLVLFFWAANRIGLSGPLFDNTVTMLAAAAMTAAALLIGREVAGEALARRAAPFLVVAPAAFWHTNADIIFGGVALTAVACLILATGRTGAGAAWLTAAGARSPGRR
ncbi:hypothetical protein GCM10029992_46790 [Glycomyces albus]